MSSIADSTFLSLFLFDEAALHLTPILTEDWCKMILKIPEVRFSLEIVASGVGDNVWVQYVDFPDAPAVEPFLFE